MGLFDKIRQGLKKTRDSVGNSIGKIIKSFSSDREEMLEELEEILICADVGANTTELILDRLREQIKEKGLKDSDEVKDLLKEIMLGMIGEGEDINLYKEMTVILVIGVNGVGKTTTIGKLAHNYKEEGKSVMLAAADTFRAAAIDQLDPVIGIGVV